MLHRPGEEIRQALRLVLRERPAPRLSEVARRLGYRGTEGLRRVSRSLCKRITDNHKKSFGPEPYYNGPRPRICGRKEIEAALKAALVQDEPESVPQVARRLGYTASSPFFKPFPALCRAIHLKIARRKAARIRAMRRIVEKALRQSPPPTLRALAVELGYKDKKVFARYFADLRAELLARRKALAKRHAAQLRRELRRYTRTELAPSMAEVCRRLGLKRLTASRKFPAEYLPRAKATFEYGLSQDSTYPSFHYNMACAYAEMNDMNKAMAYLRTAFQYKENVIPGEKMPDPRKDPSFQRFMSNEEFRKLVDSLARLSQ